MRTTVTIDREQTRIELEGKIIINIVNYLFKHLVPRIGTVLLDFEDVGVILRIRRSFRGLRTSTPPNRAAH